MGSLFFCSYLTLTAELNASTIYLYLLEAIYLAYRQAIRYFEYYHHHVMLFVIAFVTHFDLSYL